MLKALRAKRDEAEKDVGKLEVSALPGRYEDATSSSRPEDATELAARLPSPLGERGPAAAGQQGALHPRQAPRRALHPHRRRGAVRIWLSIRRGSGVS